MMLMFTPLKDFIPTLWPLSNNIIFLKMSKKIPITIGVTGLNNTDNPGPGIPVIRSLLESTVFEPKIIGLVYENLEPGIYMENHADKVYLMPYPSDGSANYMERIAYIHSKEKFDVIIPNFDAELFTFMKNAGKMKEMGIKTFLPTFDQFEERHKSNLPEFGKKYNLDVPKSKNIVDFNDIKKIKDDFTYPVMVKGKFYDAWVAYNEEQVKSHFHNIVSKWGVPVVIQEFVKGTEVNVIALGDGTGKTIGAVPMRKQYITDKGKAWGGITIDDPRMLELTRQIIRKTKWRGGMELELIKTNDNKYFIIEINPRIPAWVYLAVGAGQNLPEAMVKLAMGMELEPFTNYKIGIMFVRYSYDIICDLKKFESLSINLEL
jgi:carbamoyl-phosphate synthase large subunit